MNSRPWASLPLGLLISAFCLWYAFKDADLVGVAHGMFRVGAGWVLCSAGLAVLSHTFRAWRWRFLLSTAHPVGLKSLLSATFVGIMANNLLPARLGEVVRAWVLARHEQAPVPAVLASILVERLLDVSVALALLGFCLIVASDLDGGAVTLLSRAGFVVLLLLVAIVLGILLMRRFHERVLQAGVRWAAQPDRAWALHWLESFRRFVGGLGRPWGGMHWMAVAGLSLLVWFVAIFSFQVLAYGFVLHLSLVQTTLVFVIVLFGIAIPSAPGFVGTFHGFCVAGLIMVAGTDPTQAAAYATLLHGSGWIAINTVGLLCLLFDRSLTWTAMTKLARQE